MKPLDDTIQLLKEVIFDENCDRMNKSGVKGYLGELIVLKKLQDEGLKPKQLGNQSGVDIIVNGLKIDVKTSELKDDGFEIKNWGWALSRKDREIKYDAAVCVALDEQLNNAGFYCISSEKISLFESQHQHFKSVTNRFQKFPQPQTTTSSEDLIEAYKRSEKLISDGLVIEIAPEESLGEVILKK